MYPSVSVKDINNLMTSKQKNKVVIFEKIYDMCQTQIIKYAKNDKYRCFYEVPEFILGMPLYNLNQAIIHVLEKLKKNGFMVKYYFPNHLYISWDYQEISGVKQNMKAITSQSHTIIQPPLPQKIHQKPLFPPPPIDSRFVSSPHTTNQLTMPQIPSMDLPHPMISSSFQEKSNTKNKFIKSISDFKPSGKFVLNIS